jgi:hypothetical protein
MRKEQMTELKANLPVFEDFHYAEDVDTHVLVPTLEAVEQGLEKLGYKLTDEQSDEIFDVIDRLVSTIIPNTEYQNYN